MKRKMIPYLVFAVILCCAGGIAAQKHIARIYIDPRHGGPNAV